MVSRKKLRECQQQLTSSAEEEGARTEQLGLDILPCGELRLTSMPPLSTVSAFQKSSLSRATFPNSQTTLFDTSQYQTYLSSDRLVRIFPWLDRERVLLAIAQACFLSQSDFYEFSSLRLLFLKTSSDSSQAIGEQTLRLSSVPSLKWGMWGLGNCGMGGAGFPKAGNESSVWVLTGNVQCRYVEPDRLRLRDCLESDGVFVDRHRAGDRYYREEAPTLRALGKGSGNGVFKVQEPDGSTRPLAATESERLMGWSVGSSKHGITAEGKEILISTTRRQKMLHNGIIPQEIEDICNNLKFLFDCIDSRYNLSIELRGLKS